MQQLKLKLPDQNEQPSPSSPPWHQMSAQTQAAALALLARLIARRLASEPAGNEPAKQAEIGQAETRKAGAKVPEAKETGNE